MRNTLILTPESLGQVAPQAAFAPAPKRARTNWLVPDALGQASFKA